MEHTSIVARVQGLRPVRVPVEVTFRWVVPNRIKRDIDNLAGNGVVKAVLDALVEDKYLVDDSSRYVVAVHTEMVHEMGSRRLEIVIAPAEQARDGRDGGENQ
jgi:Holliday junction resolvase RusA-like endonuclease